MMQNLKSEIVQSFIEGKIDRRSFLSASFKLFAITSISSALGCFYTLSQHKLVLSQEKENSLYHILNFLFPKEKHSPGIDEINTIPYFHLILIDQHVSDFDKKIILNGITWLEEECLLEYQKTFFNLSLKEKEKIINKVSKVVWGENWIAKILNFTFESLLGDPAYGINVNEIGWKWLNHKPGYPRAKGAHK